MRADLANQYVLHDTPGRATMPSERGSGGVSIPRRMRDILSANPGFIADDPGQELRNLYQNASMGFDCRLLNPFAMSCFVGNLDAVMQIVESGRMDMERLKGTETEFEFGYASLVVLGSQRVEGESCNHDDTLKYLLSRGVPPDVPDICGHTALHHTMIAKPKPELTRILVKNGANVDAQERYGGVPLLIAFRINVIEIVELLLNAGAALDIPDANGTSPKSFYLSCGPEVTAVVSRWIRKRKGEEAPREEGTCGKCGKKKAPGVRLKQCSKCHSQLYCSADCQRADWKTHKEKCRPFSEENVVLVKPRYDMEGVSFLPAAVLARRMGGTSNEAVPDHRRLISPATDKKEFIVKVQIPYNPPPDSRIGYGVNPPSTAPMLVYNKKSDFCCMVEYDDDPEAYSRLTVVVREKGTGGAKAYFPAELRSRDLLAIKVADVLAEQSF